MEKLTITDNFVVRVSLYITRYAEYISRLGRDIVTQVQGEGLTQ